MTIKPPPRLPANSAEKIDTFTLPKTGQTCDVVLLSANHAQQISALNHIITDALEEGQEGFVVNPSIETLQTELSSDGKECAVGVVLEGQLIAQAMMTLPTPEQPELETWNMCLTEPPETVAALHGMRVHPDYRGNSLMAALVDARIKVAEDMGRTHIISECDVDNPHSWAVLMKKGLRIENTGPGVFPGGTIYHMHADRNRQKLADTFNKKSGVRIPANDLGQQQKAMAQGMEGVSFDKNTKAILFLPKPKGP
ncbi:MAG: GNAT family N-acetyltransferase [Alphaproteobacteria bacterium]|nr:GNAT family N-acetyltransferase [Alphaproteobacteria bacterium]